jgi:hypothetical protein
VIPRVWWRHACGLDKHGGELVEDRLHPTVDGCRRDDGAGLSYQALPGHLMILVLECHTQGGEVPEDGPSVARHLVPRTTLWPASGSA